MTEETDETNLTAYALGELDPDERAAIEAQLAADPDARRHVEEVTATARVLKDELSREPEAGLGAIQHAAIERRLQGDEWTVTPRQVRAKWNRAMWGSLAASVIIVCTVMGTVLPRIYRLGTGRGLVGNHTADPFNAPPLILIPGTDAPPNADDASGQARSPVTAPAVFVLSRDVSSRDPGQFYDLNVDLLTHVGQEIDLDLTVAQQDIARDATAIRVALSYHVTADDLRGIELRLPVGAVVKESADSVHITGRFSVSEIVERKQGIVSLQLSPRQ